MKKKMPLLLAALLLVSCGSMPKIIFNESGQNTAACPAPFIKEKYRFVHAIEASVAGEAGGAIIGVTIVDPALRLVSCAIMTVEGLVLFQAESGKSLRVIKAMHPFDSKEFAGNLIADIKLIFFAPAGELEKAGKTEEGATVCRYRQQDGRRVDVMSDGRGNSEINLYSSWKNLQRRILLTPSGGSPYQRIELQARETVNYSLIMTLIEAQPVEGDTAQDESKSQE